MSAETAAFHDLNRAADAVREAIAVAVEAAIAKHTAGHPEGTYFKITNVTVDNGKVLRDHLAIEVRKRQMRPGGIVRR